MSTYRKAAIRRTLYLLADRAGARIDILADLESVARRASREGARAFLRLNVASDLDMRRLLPGVLERAAELGIEAYDYSKAHARVLAQLTSPDVPWALSYSINERTTYAMARAIHEAGGNLVVPFVVRYYAQGKRYGTLPARVVYRHAGTGEQFATPGIDGDRYDPRVPDLDGRGVTVGLRAKGTRAALAEGIAEGFLRPGAPDAETLGDKATAGEAVVTLP